MAGTLCVVVGGARLLVNMRDQISYIEVEPQHNPGILKAMLVTAERLHLETLSDAESPPEFTPEGRMRIYLSFVEVALGA